MTLLTNNQPLADAVTVVNKVDVNAGPHTFTFDGHNQVLVIENGEAAPLTVNVLGNGVTSFTCAELGDVDVSSGLDIIVPAGETHTLYTDKREAYTGAQNTVVDLTFTGSTTAGLAYVWVMTLGL